MSTQVSSAVVAGAGIVGCVQALLLARVGFDVTLVDAADSVPALSDKAMADNTMADNAMAVRSVAVSYRSQQLLASAGLWSDLGCPIHSVLVNEQGRFGAVRFHANEFSVPALGYVIKNHLLEEQLYKLIEAEPGITLVKPASVQLIQPVSNPLCLQIVSADQTQTADAQLLVAADGTGSSLRAQLGIEVNTTDYEQCALVANVLCQRDHGNVAFERFTDSGPLALLPLDERRMALVYTVHAHRADEIRSLTDQQLIDEIQQRFGGRLGRIQDIGPRAVLPLMLTESQQQTHGCSVLIGNAARTLHPVAGQGLNLALRDVFELAGQLANEPEVEIALGKFVSARRPDQQFVVRQTDTLAKVFRKHRWPLSASLGFARQSSLLLLDSVKPLRGKFGRRNAGMGIPLTPLGH